MVKLLVGGGFCLMLVALFLSILEVSSDIVGSLAAIGGIIFLIGLVVWKLRQAWRRLDE